VALLLVALPVAALRARQAGPAPLTGTIYDVTGGVMPGVEVTLLDAEQVIQLVTTNASGRFEFAPIAAGTYVLEVKLPGFRTLRQELALRNGRDWDRAVTLQVGELQETIRVRGTRATLPKQLKSYGEGSEPVRIGGNIRPPRKLKDVKPVYPAAMREAGLSGTVPIQAIIDGEGTVSSVRVLSAQVHPDFAIAAVDAVRQWRFTPTLLNGAPVEVVMTVSVRFDLDD
jgi:TonB family protein